MGKTPWCDNSGMGHTGEWPLTFVFLLSVNLFDSNFSLYLLFLFSFLIFFLLLLPIILFCCLFDSKTGNWFLATTFSTHWCHFQVSFVIFSVHLYMGFLNQILLSGYHVDALFKPWLAPSPPDGFLWVSSLWPRFLCMVSVSWSCLTKTNCREPVSEGIFFLWFPYRIFFLDNDNPEKKIQIL